MIRKLKVEKSFKPLPNGNGDEFYANGIFEFNITKIFTFIKDNPETFQPELIPVNDLKCFVSNNLDERTIQNADMTNPILLAEIAPKQFNVIDGHHRLARAYRDNVGTISGYKIRAEHHVKFLTSVFAYENYIKYWNEKTKE